MVDYYLPSARSFVWSGSQVLLARKSDAVWEEQLVNGLTPAAAASGTSPKEQEDIGRLTFFAGALFGIGGAAIVGAVIEVLHARDWAVVHALGPR